MERLHSFCLFCAILICAVPLSADDQSPEADPDSHQWATKIESPDLTNVYQVSEGLFRGGKLEPAAASILESLGVRSVVNLRLRRSDKKAVAGTNLCYFQIPMKAWRPNDEEVVEFLSIAADDSQQPVYVCCKFGSDRTGMMCAVYRVVVQGWSKEEAIREMTQGPYGYHPIWKDVVQYVRDMDPDYLARRAGIREWQ